MKLFHDAEDAREFFEEMAKRPPPAKVEPAFTMIWTDHDGAVVGEITEGLIDEFQLCSALAAAISQLPSTGRFVIRKLK
jgi:hypothetical protein